jgi:hypothetical protein
LCRRFDSALRHQAATARRKAHGVLHSPRIEPGRRGGDTLRISWGGSSQPLEALSRERRRGMIHLRKRSVFASALRHQLRPRIENREIRSQSHFRFSIFDSLICRRCSSVVEQRFRKPWVTSSTLVIGSIKHPAGDGTDIPVPGQYHLRLRGANEEHICQPSSNCSVRARRTSLSGA